MKVSRADSQELATKNYGGPMVIQVEDFACPGCTQVDLEVATGGMPFHFRLEGELPAWLEAEPREGEVIDQVTVSLRCYPSRLPRETQRLRLHLTDGSAVVAVEVAGKAWPAEDPMTFVPQKDVVSILAEHYAEKTDVPGGAFYRIADYGKYGSGMKVAPSTAAFREDGERPSLTYRFRVDRPGDYRVELLTAPNNPVELGSAVHLLAESGGETRKVELIPPDFRGGENSDPRWCAGVLDHIHTAETRFRFDRGIHTLTLSPLEPGVVLEKIVISPWEAQLPQSYLGPQESWGSAVH